MPSSSSPSRPLRVGLLGCGAIASYFHLRALQRTAGATLTAIADSDPGARARAKQLAGVPVYETAAELLERNDVDAVVICAPTGVHAELAVAAARAGKHIYLEKPLATSATDAEEVIDAVAKAGGGVLLDLASHHIDLRWLLRDEVAVVSASIGSESSEHDSATLDLTFDEGARVQGYFSFGPEMADQLELVGEGGTLCVDRHRPAVEVRGRRRFRYGMRRRWVTPGAANGDVAPVPQAATWR